MSEFQFFNPYDDIRFTANRLPHWQQKGAVYFVTFRLADAVPQHLREQWESDRKAWLRFHPPPWDAETEREYHERFSGAIERWLDAGHGSCVLRRPHCAAVVAEALRHFDGDRVSQIAWVVMPNHVHAVFVLNPARSLEKIILSWKGLRRAKSIRCLDAKAIFGSVTISIGWFATRTIWPTVFVTSDAIRKRSVCAKVSLFCTKASSPQASTETALWKDAAP